MYVKRAVFLHIESILRDYPEMDKYIANRKNATYYTLDDDRQLSTLRWQKETVSRCLEQADNITLELVGKLYFHRNPNQTLDRVALDLHISRSRLFYVRNKFLEAVRKGLGW